MHRYARFAAVAAAAILMAVGLSPTDRAGAADPLETPKTPGELLIRGQGGKPAGACPLKHTDVAARVTGFVARVRVTQEFHNPTSDKIEAVYTFPLPDDSAVDYMEMKVGERTIVGEIRKRAEAQEIYETAKEAGHVASLLDQERPNIFTQSVANIEPGAEVKIIISYTQMLKYEAGTYEFCFPMVVGPRFHPGTPVGHQGMGSGHDTDAVPDASKITPPITPRGTRAGHDISLRVQIGAAIPIQGVKCVSHEINVESPDEDSVAVTLKDKDTIPNKDFVLRYDVAGEAIGSGVIASASPGKGGYFALVMQPPKSTKPKYVTPKEMVFVIDTSGSQMGEPLAKSKETMLHCIKNVNPGDTFNMISFSNSVKKLFDKPRPYNSANLEAALKFLKDCEAGGGTYMLPAIKEAMAGPYDRERLRVVVFFTDGYIGNDFEIVDHIQKNSEHASVFSFGIGNGVNRFLIEKMADAGRGASDVVLLNSDSKEVAAKFYERIRNPLLTDISVDWGGLPVVTEEVYPRRAPDLFSAQPLILKGYYTAPAAGRITVRGKVHGQPWSKTLDVELPDEDSGNDPLASIWARSKVDDLMSRDWLGAQSGKPDPTIEDRIVKLALDYNLMTQYTSFVAVERMTVTSGGHATTVAVPVEMPEGVSYEGVYGDSDGSAKLGLQAGFGGYSAGRGVHYYAATPSAAAGAPLARRQVAEAAAPPAGASLRVPAEPSSGVAPPKDASLMVLDSAADGKESAGTTFDAETVNGDALSLSATALVKQRLDKTLRDLVEKYKKQGESGSYSIPGKLEVKDSKVQVMVWLKSAGKEKVAQIEKLGFSDHAWALQDRVLIGWVPIDKLEELAKLEFIARITCPDYTK